MSAVENSTPPKKRRTRRPSLPALAAKMGLTPRALEQAPDGTLRLIFGNSDSVPAVNLPNEWDSVA